MQGNIIFDGAFGTYFATKNSALDLPEMANILSKDTVLDIHKEYIESGVDAIKTNTFAANSTAISDETLRKSVIESGYALAMQAVSQSGVKVFSDIGPINHPRSEDEYVQIADIFIACGAKNFLFETLSEAQDLRQAIAHIKRSVQGATVIASFAASQDGYTRTGKYYKDLLDEASSYGADYVGLNCICGPAHMLNLIRQVDTSRYRVTAMPNAGYPSVAGRRTIYVDNPDYFADKLFEMYNCGVGIIGGCCGTTPNHIRAIVEKLRSHTPQKRPRVKTAARESVKPQAFSDKRTLIAVEINSPIDTDIQYILEASKTAKQCGADFITIPDSPLAKARANSFMISGLIQREAGIAVIPHICCRDKNQIAIKGDLIAAGIERISNVLAITGDPIPETDRAEASHVFGFNSYRLISFIRSLNENLFAAAPFRIFAALNINAPNFAQELKRAETKIQSGASCFLTQPIFSDQNIANYNEAKKRLPCKIFAGIMPVAGYQNALFLNNEVPEIEIPQTFVESLKGKGKDEAHEICIAYAKSIVDKIPQSDGYYIMSPLNKIALSTSVIEYIRRK